MTVAYLLDWIIAALVVLAVLWGTSRATVIDVELSDKGSEEEDEESEEKKV